MTPRERHFPRDTPGLPWGATLTPTAPSAPRSPATLRGPWPEQAEPGSPPRCGHPPLGRIARLAHWTSRGWEQHAAAASTEEPGRPGRVTCAHSGVLPGRLRSSTAHPLSPEGLLSATPTCQQQHQLPRPGPRPGTQGQGPCEPVPSPGSRGPVVAQLLKPGCVLGASANRNSCFKKSI